MAPKKKKTQSEKNSIMILPKDILSKILGLCTMSSIYNLLQLRLVCKSFKKICDEDDSILSETSLANVQFNPYVEKTEVYYEQTKRLCNAGNRDILYWTAIYKFFYDNNKDEGLALFCDASLAMVHDAQYLYGLILICLGDKEKQKGYIQLKTFMKPLMSETVAEVSNYNRRVHINLSPKTFTVQRELLKKYMKQNCGCNGATTKFIWLDGAGNDMSSSSACQICFWDHQVRYAFCCFHDM